MKTLTITKLNTRKFEAARLESGVEIHKIESSSALPILSYLLEELDVNVADLVDFQLEQAIYCKPVQGRPNPYGFLSHTDYDELKRFKEESDYESAKFWGELEDSPTDES